MFDGFEVEGLVEEIVKSGIFAAVGLFCQLRFYFTGSRDIEAESLADARDCIREFPDSGEVSSSGGGSETSLMGEVFAKGGGGEFVKIGVIFFGGVEIIAEPVREVKPGRGSEICVIGLFAIH